MKNEKWKTICSYELEAHSTICYIFKEIIDFICETNYYVCLFFVLGITTNSIECRHWKYVIFIASHKKKKDSFPNNFF